MAALTVPAAGRDLELRAALALAGAEILGPHRVRLLVDRLGSPLAVLERGDFVHDVHGVGPKSREQIRRLAPVSAGRLEEIRRRGIRLFAYGLPGYPERLNQLYHPPIVLHVTGGKELPRERCVAIVGTRKATGYGRRMAGDLAAQFARAGWTVVSGMALGIDGEAHRGALEAGGVSVGVLGCGLDHEYPPSHAALHDRMRRHGVLVSEFPPEELPRGELFPRRNRIIAALSEAVIVVQAGEKSGTTHTVDHAQEIGLDVFAVPGPVGPPASVGVHNLLRDGAMPATSAEDVLKALKLFPSGDGATEDDGGGHRDPGASHRSRGRRGGGRRGRDGSAAAARVPEPEQLAFLFGEDAGPAAALCRGLEHEPRDADQLSIETGLEPGRTSALLTRLELAGRVRALPGGRFELRGG